MSYDYEDSLSDTARDRYKAKLQASDLSQCPYKFPAGQWLNDPTKWPSLQWPDVCAYLIETPGVFTQQAMKNDKSLEAHNYFVSGWVQAVLHMPLEKSRNMVFKADIKPSQRTNDDPHHPWVTMENDGTVLSAHCDCMAGLGESCSHVAALLFKIEAAVRLGYTSLACTEQPCAWNQCFVKKVQPDTIANIKFYKDSSKGKTGKFTVSSLF